LKNDVLTARERAGAWRDTPQRRSDDHARGGHRSGGRTGDPKAVVARAITAATGVYDRNSKRTGVALPTFPILLVEDRESLRAMLRHALEAQGHVVVEASDEPTAIEQLQQARPAVVLTDLKLPIGDGFGVLKAAKELDPELPVVVMTAYGSIQDAVTAMKEGAMDFLAKPVDPDHLLLMVERAMVQRRMLTDYFLLKQELGERRGAPRIIGEDRSCAGVAAAPSRGGH
jgi:CheY-like chemotaxis protein